MLLFTGSTGLIFAQSSYATANASATIVTAISIAKTQDLVFGSLTPSATAGTVTVDQWSTRSSTGGVTVILSSSHSAATFTVTGVPSASYNIILPSSINLTSGANSMTVNSLVSSIGTSGTLWGGTQSFNVGATLNVNASQPEGTYTGTFNVTVAYY